MMKPLAIAILTLAYGTTGCKGVDETRLADKGGCVAMIKSIEVNSRLLGAVTRRLTDADRAVTRADRWKQKTVTDAEDRGGLFSGAETRAPMHAGSALSLCEAARTLHAGIESIAHAIHEPAVHADEHVLKLECFDQFMVASASKEDREKVAAEWQAQLVEIQKAESRYHDSCKAKFDVEEVSVDGWPLAANTEPPIK